MFELTEQPIDARRAKEKLKSSATGALVEFTGLVRDRHEGRDVVAIELSAHRPLANSLGADLIRKAIHRHDIEGAHLIHRLGRVPVGEATVWVGVVSPHRKNAFEAAAFLMDRLKTEIPIWKKEIGPEGSELWQSGTPLAVPEGKTQEVPG